MKEQISIKGSFCTFVLYFSISVVKVPDRVLSEWQEWNVLVVLSSERLFNWSNALHCTAHLQLLLSIAITNILPGNKQCGGLRSLHSLAGSHHFKVRLFALRDLDDNPYRNVLGTKCLADILSEREKIANWMEQTLGNSSVRTHVWY